MKVGMVAFQLFVGMVAFQLFVGMVAFELHSKSCVIFYFDFWTGGKLGRVVITNFEVVSHDIPSLLHISAETFGVKVIK